MVSDQALRARLAAETAHLAPDVEAELESVFRRADTRRSLRWSGYAVGLAAAVAAIVVLVGLDLVPRAEETPEPLVDIPVQALVPGRGMYADPAAIDPGRYRVDVKQTRRLSGIRTIDIDVPPGWGQDDKYALATGPWSDSTARRLDVYGKVSRVHPDPCSSHVERVGPGAYDVARSLASLERVSASRPLPVTIDGSAGYIVRVDIPTAQSAETCGDGRLLRWWPGREGDSEHGWTELLYVLDVEGQQQIAINASHGPRATQAEVDELVRMVESVTFAPP